MTPVFWFFLLLFVSPRLWATEKESSERCMSQHLTEAIELNKSRQATYADISQGASLPLSQLLLASERAGWFGAQILEAAERPLRDHGLAILCETLVPMSLTPEAPEGWEEPPAEVFESKATARVRKEMLVAWQSGGYARLKVAAAQKVAELGLESPYHCMVRHLLESIARGAALGPSQIARAEEQGFGLRARGVIDTFLRAQIELLGVGREIDRRAAPLQARGLPIVCRDVPPIAIPEGEIAERGD